MDDRPKFQFSLTTALVGIMLIGGWIGLFRFGLFRYHLHYYVLLFALVAVIAIAATQQGKRWAFWLGFAIVFGLHVTRVLFQPYATFFQGEGGLVDFDLWRELFFQPVLGPILKQLDDAMSDAVFHVSWVMFVVTVSTLGGILSSMIYSRLRREQ